MPADIAAVVSDAELAARSMKFDDAVTLFNRAIAGMESRLPELGDIQALVDAHIALARSYLTTGESTLATTSFTRAVGLRPGLELDTRRYSPKIIEVFASAKRDALAEPTCVVRIDVGIPGTRVELDSVAVGTAPLTLRPLKGKHVVRIQAEGYEPMVRELNLTAGGSTEIREALAPLPARQIANNLLREAAAEGRPQKVLALGRNLAGELRADAVLVAGVAPLRDGYAIVAALTHEPVRQVVGTLPTSLARADALLSAMLARLVGPATTEIPILSFAKPPPSLEDLELSFEDRFLGVVPAVPSVVVSGGDGDGPTAYPSDDDSVWSSPWLWTGVGAAVVAGAVTTVLLLMRSTEQIQDPDELHITVRPVP